jgi:O-antigen ligase
MFKGPAEDMGLVKSSKEAVIFSPQVHDSLIRTAYNMFKDQPIFGHGPKMFRVMCR